MKTIAMPVASARTLGVGSPTGSAPKTPHVSPVAAHLAEFVHDRECIVRRTRSCHCARRTSSAANAAATVACSLSTVACLPFCPTLEPDLLGGRPVVVAENAAHSLSAANGAGRSLHKRTIDQLVRESLMIALAMIVRGEFVQRLSEVPLT
jgi:hypothetical protein